MDWIDCSVPLRHGMVGWPGDPAVDIEAVATLAADGVAVSRISLGSHAGTHIDAPAHFLQGGTAVDAIPLGALLGPCRVLDLRHARPHVGREHLEGFAPGAGERLLLKTSNGAALREPAFRRDYVALDVSAARCLAEAGVALVAIDYLSIDPFEASGYPAHHVLLGAGVVVVEGVDLHDVPAGRYDLAALPLRLAGLDGSPGRVALRRQS